jgi:DEAD/DEAH box helicase domain-containing protein
MSVEDALRALRHDPGFMRNVTAWELLPARPARYGTMPDGLEPRLIAALRELGLSPLYSHQAAALEASLGGEHVAVVTGTASGKTLCYNLPVLQTLLSDPEARALYLFPTKALAQDQAAVLHGLLQALAAQDQVAVRTYDGDTPQAQRREVREDVRLLISNPDMLHTGILPHHTRWAPFLENLRWVVLDELHVYRGVFGSNVANLLRRLRRVCSFYGSAPQFVLTSATIANPKELAERLIEAPVRLIPADLDGSPRAAREIILYNPPVVDARLGVRRAYTLEATRIGSAFLRSQVQTVVFARSRQTTELLLGYLRDSHVQDGGQAEDIRGYRGGYLPLERRAIESGLRTGSVRGVVATNALELGVDIGLLGASIVAGYPGTIASLWQQMGRAGRRSEASTAVLVASAAPLDQFVVAHPRFLFEQTPEMGLIQPDNLSILVRHLRCAAFELPFASGEGFGDSSEAREVLDLLAESGDLHRTPAGYHWVGPSYPAEGVSLRESSDQTVVIQDRGQGRPQVIGSVDRAAAPVQVHEGAVYVHEGRTYLVERLDWENAVAQVSPMEVDYYTDASEAVELDVLEVFDADEAAEARRAHGRVLVTAQATTFRKVKRYTHETLGYGTIDLPKREYETTGFWMWLAPELVERLERQGVLTPPNDYGPDWPAAREAARSRDGHQCRQCRAPERPGRAHDVHHLRPFREFGYAPGENRNDRLANSLDNLITLCAPCHHRAEFARGTRSALGGLAYALGNIAPLFLMCDPRDLAVEAEVRGRQTHSPTLTFYDRLPEGLGLSERLYDHQGELLAAALDLVRDCGCSEGCPACVGPIAAGGAEVKQLTARLLQAMQQPPAEVQGGSESDG